MSESFYEINKTNIKDWLENLLKQYQLFGPKLKESVLSTTSQISEFFIFEEIYDPSDLRLDYPTSILPPIKVFFPNDETLLSYNIHDLHQIKSNIQPKKSKVMMGVHPCDIHSIQLMDKIFSKDPKDEYYLSRREDTYIIGLNCFSPCSERTLCYDKRTYRADSGFDILLWEDKSTYIIEVKSNKGKELIENQSYFNSYKNNFLTFQKDFYDHQSKSFTKHLVLDINNLKESLIDVYNSKIWQDLGEKCLSCGSCNIVCPTCYCFDTYDDINLELNEGVRCRKWDSCQNEVFACVGSGENFRERSSQRNRHRIFKKEVYVLDNYGESGCVGCGRCNTSCIANISLIDIYNRALTKEIY